MENKKSFMQTTPIFKLIIKMSVPVMISMLIQALYNIIDSIYVSRLGTDALTAISLAYPIQNVILAVSVGTGVGISSAISIYLGAGKHEEANKAATIGLALTGVHCLIVTVLGLFFTRTFIGFFTSDPAILEPACIYTYIVVCVSFGWMFQITLEKIYQGIGEMKITMYLMASGCVINIILDPILIFGLFGFPELGIAGAAIATVIGQVSATVLYVVVYFKKNFAISLNPRHLCMDKKIIGQIYNVGIPSAIMIMMPSVLVSALNRILAAISSVHIAVLGVYYKLQTFIYMPANGLVQGMRPIIGYNYGAGENERVKKTIKCCLAITAVIMTIGTVLALGIPKQIFMMFDAEPELLESGIVALRIICLGFIVSTIGIIYSGTFEALGMGKYSLIVSLLRQFVITVPLAFVLSKFMGAAGVWSAFPAGEIVATIVAVVILKKHDHGKFDIWKKNN